MKTTKFYERSSMLLAVLMGLFMSFSLVSCSDDDDEETDRSSMMLGVWELTRTSGLDQTGATWDKACNAFTGSAMMQFMQGGTGSVLYYENSTLTGYKKFTYKLIGNNLTINYPDGPKAYEMLTLNGGQIVYKDSENNKNQETYKIETFYLNRVNMDVAQKYGEILFGAAWEAYRMAGTDNTGAAWDEKLDYSDAKFVWKFKDRGEATQINFHNGNEVSRDDISYLILGQKLFIVSPNGTLVSDIASLTISEMVLKYKFLTEGVIQDNTIYLKHTLNY